MPKLQFTKRSILLAKCQTGKKRTVYSDKTTMGLVLEARATGGKTFYVRYIDQYGSQRNYRIGDASSISLDIARKITVKIKSQIAAGHDPFKERQEKKIIQTLNEFFETYYLSHAQTYKRSWKYDIGVYKRHIKPFIGDKRVDAIKTVDILAIQNGMKQNGYAAGTCNRVLILIQHMFNLMIRWNIGRLTENPCKTIKQFKITNHHQRFLTREEVRRLLDALKQSPHPYIYYIVTFLLLTGARKQEALQASWRDFNFNSGVWLIPKTKSGKPRSVPISKHLSDMLMHLPSRNHSIWLFPNPDTGKPYVSTFYPWNTARKKAGLADVRMHDLRHSFASFLINSGRSLYEVQKLLGHSSISTTERYAHLSNETLSSAVNIIGDFVNIENEI